MTAKKSNHEYINGVYLGTKSPVRLMFTPALAEPRKIGDKGDPKFEVQIGFPKDHTDVAVFRAAELAVAKKRWGDKVDMGNLQSKLLDGDAEYEYGANNPNPEKVRTYEWLKGTYILKLRSKNPIVAFDNRKRDANNKLVPIVDKEELKTLFYAGANVAVNLTGMTYDEIPDRRNPAKTVPPGVTFMPEQILFISNGERFFSGGKNDGSGFGEVQGGVSEENPFGEGEEPAF